MVCQAVGRINFLVCFIPMTHKSGEEIIINNKLRAPNTYVPFNLPSGEIFLWQSFVIPAAGNTTVLIPD